MGGLTLTLAFFVGNALGAERRVGADNYPTFAEAAAAAVDGDVIVVPADYTPEDHVVELTHPLTVRGDRGVAALPSLSVAADVQFVSVLFSEGASCEAFATPVALCVLSGRVDVVDSQFDGPMVGAAGRVAGGDLRLERVDIANFAEGGISVGRQGSLSILDSSLVNTGGAVASEGGFVSIARSTFTQNFSDVGGADLQAVDADVMVTDTVFRGRGGDNAQTALGGSLSLVGGTLHAIDATWTEYRAFRGAVLASAGAEVSLDSVYASDVVAVSDGGFAWAVGGELAIRSSIFDNVRSSLGNGGLVAGESAAMVADRLDVYGTGAAAAQNGGAFAVNGGSLVLTQSVFSDVGAEQKGGVLWVNAADATVGDSRFLRGFARSGGAIAAADGYPTVVRSVFCSNNADLGGAIFGSRVSLGVENSQFIGNAGAGAVIASSGAVSLRYSTFVEDEPTADSARIVVDGALELSNSILYGDGRGLAADAARATGGFNLWSGVESGMEAVFPSFTDVFGDPEFASYAGPTDCEASLWLKGGSPAIDAGDPSEVDPDGTRADIGAFGGPHARLPDEDGDGFTWGTDCDDSDPAIHPGAADIALDGADQDCDGLDACDQDGDGLCAPIDCDDTNGMVFPGAPEVPYDGVDQDCSGSDACDLDGDGARDRRCGGDDCDDGDADRGPGQPETPGDGVDADCDGADGTSRLSGGAGTCDSTGRGVFSAALFAALWVRRRR